MWDETVHIMHDLFDNVWGNRDVVEVSNATELTVPVGPARVSSMIASEDG